MSITHLKTEAYVRACLRENKVTRIEHVIIECPECGFEVLENDANYCGGCGHSFADLQYSCEGCGAKHLMILSGPHCEICGHKRDHLLDYPINLAQTILNHQMHQAAHQ